MDNINQKNKINQSEKNIGVAFLLNFCFSIFELIGGLFTNSISIISDSVHDFGDCLSIGISWFLEKKSTQKPNKFYTYGYQKFSVLGALINSVILVTGSLLMLFGAIARILRPEKINYDGVLILAVIGFLINGYATFKTIRGEKINERTVGLHMLEDVLSWAAVLITGMFMKIFDWYLLDPILSMFISLFILFSAIKNIKSVFEIFLDKSQVNINELEDFLVDGKKILDIHHIHSWTDGLNNFLTLHAIINNVINIKEVAEIKKSIRNKLAQKKISHVTIEIEFKDENCDQQECEYVYRKSKDHYH